MGAVTFESGVSPSSYARNPTVVLWGPNQFDRTGVDYGGVLQERARPSGNNNFVYLLWAKKEAFFGGSYDWVEILTPQQAIAPVLSADSPPSFSNRERTFFRLLPGKWKFSMVAKIAVVRAYEQARIYRVKSGDDVLIAESSASQASSTLDPKNPDTTSIRVIPKTAPVEVAQNDVFYVIDGSAGADSVQDRSQFMELEYMGT